MASTIRCPLLSLREWERDTRYSAKGTMGNGGMQAASEIEMRHLCEIDMRHLPAISCGVMGVRVGFYSTSNGYVHSTSNGYKSVLYE